MLIAQSIGIGVLVAMRSMTLPANASDYMAQHRTAPEQRSGLATLLAHPGVALLSKAMALGELAADKLPFMPNRTDPLPLLGRVFVAAGLATALARPRQRVPSAIIAGISAAIASHVLHQIRSHMVNDLGVPAFGAALMEDAAAIGGSMLWRDQFAWHD